MKIFLDTSVFVAAFWGDHVHHAASVKLAKAATPKTAFCAAHTVAEVYSTMTRLPVKPPIPAEQALLFIRQIREKFTVVSLTASEYFETIERLAEKGIARSYIYDGLIMTAARKSGADTIYTWDVDDFVLVSESATEKKIRTP
ncbi:MAG: PIN domain-containing protein [Bryobacterales bacterium]|nr:PIN domain-containing protein [Bryobacterales bacterium]